MGDPSFHFLVISVIISRLQNVLRDVSLQGPDSSSLSTLLPEAFSLLKSKQHSKMFSTEESFLGKDAIQIPAHLRSLNKGLISAEFCLSLNLEEEAISNMIHAITC